MNGSKVLKELHVAFTTIRSENNSDCPAGVDFVLTGNASTWLTLTVETWIDDSLTNLVDYTIGIVGDTLTIEMNTIAIYKPAHLAALRYATRMTELAHNFVNHNNYDWTTA